MGALERELRPEFEGGPGGPGGSPAPGGPYMPGGGPYIGGRIIGGIPIGGIPIGGGIPMGGLMAGFILFMAGFGIEVGVALGADDEVGCLAAVTGVAG